MCTSLTIENAQQQPLLARTMDFPTTSPWLPIYLPRKRRYTPATETNYRTTKYALLGGGRQVAPKTYLMADGVNEAGLACAELYFPFEATYHPKNQPQRLNLSPQDFITWVLGEHASIAEVAADLPNIALVSATWHQLNKIYPYHWALTDPTGATAVLEPRSLSLTLQPNPLGVLTNTPNLLRHGANLAAFLGLAKTSTTTVLQRAAATFQGPLPTGTIPTDRFLRATILRAQLPATFSTTDLFHILDQVIIPKTDTAHLQNHDYTHYEMFLNTASLTYTFHDLNTNRWQHLSLADYAHISREIVFS
ncbi:choloylglycine hydrolase [Agrilactobacillus composti DSM 18527 = JCM 14202]|uniref:Choloylglycine hydrolase n=1 Tax=Agrilactobacillus composti DSM 18527 = JCM 14202 TaxID=1423734 RepID=X0PU81_9LACO|nr:linear amide C-N hydrolase [Agrilactobacillus composti]KRM35565.1 choloylglycine hydrolase [Agrilactobacillus composti DSM 18527 = JCM 14202]GAF41632.1 choloylglycine hydrolase [Agrilactobacillus composti DSM 18527 = JCM 14202]